MPWLLACLYLILVNALAFILFGHDKNCAVAGTHRVSEATLLQLALIGGSAGAFLGRAHFRHKTRKQPFSTQLQLIAMLQAGVAAGLAFTFA